MADCKYIIERSNLHNVRKQASEFLCDLDARVTVLEIQQTTNEAEIVALKQQLAILTTAAVTHGWTL